MHQTDYLDVKSGLVHRQRGNTMGNTGRRWPFASKRERPSAKQNKTKRSNNKKF
jgi:hypothetical protein